jgi:hypothetical protein
VPLSIVEMGTIVGIVTAYLGATEATKRWFFGPRGPAAGDDWERAQSESLARF